MHPRVLVIAEAGSPAQWQRSLGFRPAVVRTLDEARRRMPELAPAFILIDLPEPGLDLTALRALAPAARLVVVADPGPHEQLQRGGDPSIGILTRPVTAEALETAVHRAAPATVHPQETDAPSPRPSAPLRAFEWSPKMRAIGAILDEVADTNATILLRGESGVGKDVAARYVHTASSRREKPFVKVNCAALPADLLESELFGHEKGAFTGAYRGKPGKFEYANQGTIYLDEIGELPQSLQAKLLHVIEDLRFSRLGGRETITVDTRIIASTNRNLEAAMSCGEFREDLYYRLNVVEIRLPPLRERKEEIPALASSFLADFNRQYGRKADLPASLAALFLEHSWPGNVRELENIIRRLVVLGSEGHVEEEVRGRMRATIDRRLALSPADPSPTNEAVLGLKEIAHRAALEAERKALLEVLERVRWNRSEAARILRVSYKTILAKIAESGLDPRPADRA